MIARIQQSMKEKDKGFTLIELLVVIIIIGILAAIAIPVFLNQREKAVDTGIKSDLRTIATEVESWYVDNQAYPASTDFTGLAAATGTDTIALGTANMTKSHEGNHFVYTPDATTDSFTITGTNAGAGTGLTFTYDSADGGLDPEGS